LSNAVTGRLIVFTIALTASGCFPYRQWYRDPISGVVIDKNNQPVAGAAVVACTTDGWHSVAGCPRKAAAQTDKDGRFHLSPLKEWEWCCFGEAPRPQTYLAACAHDSAGRLTSSPRVIVGRQPDSELRLSLSGEAESEPASGLCSYLGK
jgi:hypothetical protein